MADKFGLDENFDIYELPVRKTQTLDNIKAKKEMGTKSKKASLTPGAIVFFALVCVLFTALIYSYTQINELTVEGQHLEKSIAQLEKEKDELIVKANQKLDFEAIGMLAESRLGMVKMNKANVEYLDLSRAYSIEAKTSETENEDSVENLLSSIASSLSVILGYVE